MRGLGIADLKTKRIICLEQIRAQEGITYYIKEVYIIWLILNQKITKDLSVVDLYKRVVNQSFIDTMVSIPVMEKLSVLAKKEDWVNGISEYLFKELPLASDFTVAQDLKIGDFNPLKSKLRSAAFSIEKIRYVADKFEDSELLRSFATSATRAKFISKKKSDLFERMKLDMYNYFLGTLLQGTNKLFTYNFDKTIDTKANAKETESSRLERFLISLNKLVKNFELPSKTRAKWVNDGSYEIFHSASASQLLLVINSVNEVEINKLISSRYHYQKILPETNVVSLDFSEIAGVDSKLDAILVDKRAFIKGIWISKIPSVKQLLKFSTVVELLYTVGFARLPIYPVIKFAKSA